VYAVQPIFVEFVKQEYMTFDWTALENVISTVPVNTARATNLAVGVNAAVREEGGVKDAGIQVLKTPVPVTRESSIPRKEVEGRSAASASEKQVEAAMNVTPATAMDVDAAPVAEKGPPTLRRIVPGPARRIPGPLAPAPIVTKAKQSNPAPLPKKSPAPRESPGLCIGILPTDAPPLIKAREKRRREEELEIERELDIKAAKRRGKAREVVGDTTAEGGDEDDQEDSESGAKEGQPRKKKVKIDEPVTEDDPFIEHDPKCARCEKLHKPCFSRPNKACENCSGGKQGCSLPHRVKKTSATAPTKAQLKAAKSAREVDAASGSQKKKGRLARVMGRMPKIPREEEDLDENAEAIEEEGEQNVEHAAAEAEAEAEVHANPVRKLRSAGSAAAKSPAPSSAALSSTSNDQNGKRKPQRKERTPVGPAQFGEPSGNAHHFTS
jgi:hypothetical protein